MEFGLIGNPLGHSYSVPIHACLGEYRYELFPVDEAQMDALMQDKPFIGLNVTIPYKQAVMQYLDAVSPEACRIQAVNTIVKSADGRLTGYNTDLYGMKYMAAQTGVCLRGKKALILGSGGTSKTARAMLEDAGAAEIVVVSRKGPVRYEDLDVHKDAEVIINTTPVGMYPHTQESPVDLTRFPKLCCVLDVVYNPMRTALLLQAEKLNIVHAGGLNMLVAQAKRASELFTGKSLDDALIEKTVAHMKRQMLNLILIGMPGSGKTELGRALAARLGREAVDMDEWIERTEGISPREIILTQGEDAFRRIETRAVAELGKRSGLVISTGGGVVVRPENRDLLRQNGVLIQLHRPLEQLSTKGRPLSANLEALRHMQALRAPLYAAFADRHIDNTGTIEQAVIAAQEAFYEAVGD